MTGVKGGKDTDGVAEKSHETEGNTKRRRKAKVRTEQREERGKVGTEISVFVSLSSSMQSHCIGQPHDTAASAVDGYMQARQAPTESAHAGGGMKKMVAQPRFRHGDVFLFTLTLDP